MRSSRPFVPNRQVSKVNKDVILHLHSTIMQPGETPTDREAQNMQLKKPASYYEKEQVQLIFYTEEDPDSGAKTRCRLEVHDRKLVIMRTGVTTNQMELVIGKTTSTKYHTPFGLLEFDITTDTLQIKQSENELKILACYTLASEGSVVSKHTLHIKLLNA